MNYLRQLCVVTILTFVFTLTAQAGEIGTMKVLPSSNQPTASVTGEIGTMAAPTTAGKIDSPSAVTTRDGWEVFSAFLRTVIWWF